MPNVRIPTSDPRKAQAALRAGAEGYYVRNSRTRIVVAGPFKREDQAQRQAEHLAEGIVPPGLMEVTLIGRAS